MPRGKDKTPSKRGSAVHSIRITLSDNSHRPGLQASITKSNLDKILPLNLGANDADFKDNTYDAPGELSLATTAGVLQHCPNLRGLILNYRGMPNYDDPDPSDGSDGSEDSDGSKDDYCTAKCIPEFKEQLITVMSTMSKLQAFEIECEGTRSVDIDCVVQVLKKLPLLESLACTYIGRGDAQSEPGALIGGMAGLSKLSVIYLHDIRYGLRGKWDASHSLPNVKNLAIVRCADINLLDMPKNISVFTPNLTQLDLNFRFAELTKDDPNEASSYKPDINPDQVFCLPHLKFLALRYDVNYDFVRSFKDCKNLCHLDFYGPRLSQMANFSTLVRESTWPNLKILRLGNRGGEDPNGKAERAVDLLYKYCEEANVEFEIPADTNPYTDWMFSMG